MGIQRALQSGLFGSMFPILRPGVNSSTDWLKIEGIKAELRLSIYLPPDYKLPFVRYYPLAYFFDGQNLFEHHHPNGSMSWQLHRLLDQRWQRGLTVPIVIGLHLKLNPEQELVPWSQAGKRILASIALDLHPEILSSLPVLSGPEHTLLGGEAEGGLMALGGAFDYRELFGSVLSLSPPLAVHQPALIRLIQCQLIRLKTPLTSLKTKPIRLFLDTTCLENSESLQMPEQLTGLLKAQGWVEGYDFLSLIERHNPHQNRYRRITDGLDFLYGAKRSAKRVA